MTDPLDLDALEALIAKATPGPLRARGQLGAVIPAPARPVLLAGPDGAPIAWVRSVPDVRLIVAAVNALPTLIADLRAARRERDGLETAAIVLLECEPRRYQAKSHRDAWEGLRAALAALRTGGGT